MVFLALLIVPVIIGIITYFILHTITWQEFLLGIGIQIIIAGISVAIIYNMNTSDTEVWGGVVASKTKDKVSCEHSYDCNCRDEESCSGSGKNRSCTSTRVCDTCYEHSYDYSWRVHTSNGELVTINRVNRQGTITPPRWAMIKLDEPTSIEHTYENFIKAAPGSLFKREGFKNIPTPPYPKVHDYYRMNRLIGTVPVKNPQAWNAQLEDINGHIAKKKQANLLIVTTNRNKDFYFALQQAWLGGKKNDIVLVIGLDGLDIKWADVLAWSQTKDINVQLRDDIMDLGVMDREKVLEIFKNDTLRYYKRKPMHDFEYLKSSITPTTTQWVVSMIIGTIVSIGLAILFHFKDIFGVEGHNSYYRRFRRF